MEHARRRALALRSPRHTAAAAMAITALAALHIAQAVWAPGASAAAGDPFDPETPAVFVVSDRTGATGLTDSTLSRIVTQADGSLAFEQEGELDLEISGLAYNNDDGYLYGFSSRTAQVVKIGEGGQIVDEEVLESADPGLSTEFAAINPANGLFYLGGNAPGDLAAVDLENGTSTTITLTEESGVKDFVFVGSSLWGFRADGSAVRIDPDTGQVDVFPGAIPAGTEDVESVWRYSNGTIALLRETSGEMRQLRIIGDDTAAPVFVPVSSSTSPGLEGADAASTLGGVADLAVSLNGPASVTPGSTAEYTMTVRNAGTGMSSGSVATVALPRQADGWTTSSLNCEVIERGPVGGETLACRVPPLAPGATFTVTVSGTADVSATEELTTTATVLGNEDDLVAANGAATVIAPLTTAVPPTVVPPAAVVPPTATNPGAAITAPSSRAGRSADGSSASRGDRLADTGGDVEWAAIAGAAALLTGGALLLVLRRRRPV